MRILTATGTRVSCLCILGFLFFGIETGHAQAPAPCDTCEDLCRLMDKYQQKNKAVEIWSQYTGKQAQNLPQGVTTGAQLQEQYEAQFKTWLAGRRPAPDASSGDLGQLPCELKGGSGQPVVDLMTSTGTSTCDIIVQSTGNKLEGQVLQSFELAANCKAETDAVIAHEKVHEMHCKNAYQDDPVGAADFLSSPRMTAESELEAYLKHRDELANAIRDIVRKKGCGWQPTLGQQNDPKALPSLKQIQSMSQRAWTAAAALSDGGVSP